MKHPTYSASKKSEIQTTTIVPALDFKCSSLIEIAENYLDLTREQFNKNAQKAKS